MIFTECPIVYLTEPWIDTCPGQVTCALPDLDQDGVVGIKDFLDLLGLWGTANCFVFKRGDINMDGEVDINDMLIILSVWGIYDKDTWERCGCDTIGQESHQAMSAESAELASLRKEIKRLERLVAIQRAALRTRQ